MMAYVNQILRGGNMGKKTFWLIGINNPFVSPQVSIVWPDQHTSVFDADWLKKRCFSDDARRALQEELHFNGESSL